jgi:hypothetical protein
MIPNCEGCKTELAMMCEYVKKYKLHIATTKESELFGKRHLNIILVDDDGREKVNCDGAAIERR